MKIVKNLIFIAVWLMLPLALHAQHPLADALKDQYREWPQERLYMHTASDEYISGDNIWLKVYIVDAQKLQNIDGSRYAYVELADSEGRLKLRKKIIVRGGLYAGMLRIPEGCSSGLYTLRAYTRYAEDTPWNIYERPLQIGQSKALARIPTQADSTTLFRVFHEDGGLVTLAVPESSYYFIAECRMEPFFTGGIRAGTGITFQEMPEGTVSFYALDRDYNIVGRHTEYTSNGERQCRIGLKTNKKQYRKGDKATIALDVSGLDADEIADLSISVSKNRHPLGENIGTTLLQSNPSQGFDLKKVFSGEIQEKPSEQEALQSLTGNVRASGSRKGVPNANVKLIAPKIGQFAVVNADEKGYFSFNGLDDPEGTYYVVSATNAKGSENVILDLNEPVYPSITLPSKRFTEVSDTTDIEYGGIDIDQTIELKSAVISAEAPDPEIKGISSMADFTYGLKQIEEMDATCLHEVLRRVPGVFIKEERVYLRAVTSIYADVPAAIAIDGVIMPIEYDLDNIEMHMVERVDVFKTGQTVIWGSAGGGGVVSITTKSGATRPVEYHPNVKKITLLGYQPKQNFEPDYRTLYWNPSVQDTSLSFPVAESASPGKWRITLEGVTSKGRYIHEESELYVK